MCEQIETEWRQHRLDALIHKYKNGYFTRMYGNDEILVFQNEKVKRCVNIIGLEVQVHLPNGGYF